MLEEGEGDKALQRPDHRLRDLRLGARRQGGPGLYHSPEVGCHFDELLEPIRRPLGIGDVAAEERGAAVELEIEVAAVRLRLREELHATVLPDGIVVSRSEAAHVAVLNAEDAVNPAGVIEQPGGGAGVVVAALGPEVFNLQRLGLLPDRVWPLRVKRRSGTGGSNGVVHARYSRLRSGAIQCRKRLSRGIPSRNEAVRLLPRMSRRECLTPNACWEHIAVTAVSQPGAHESQKNTRS